MGCNCGKKRMAQYSSRQLQRQASGQAVDGVDGAIVASATGEFTATGQNEQSSVDSSTSHGAAAR